MPKMVGWIDEDGEYKSPIESVHLYDPESPPATWAVPDDCGLEELTLEHMLDLSPEPEPRRVRWFGGEDDSTVVTSVRSFQPDMPPTMDHDVDVVMGGT